MVEVSLSNRIRNGDFFSSFGAGEGGGNGCSCPAMLLLGSMDDLPCKILILSGPPGAGKTTTAQALADMASVPAVHLHADDFWRFIRRGAVPPYLPEAQRQNEVVIDVLTRAADGYAAGGYFVIVDGIIGPWFLEPFRALRAPTHYIVLRPPLAAAIERCRLRGGDTLTDPGPIAALHEQLGSLGELERHVLETDGQSRQDTLRAVAEALESSAFRLAR